MPPTPTRIPQGWYHPTPFGKLRAIAAFGLLNVVVRSAEADRLTSGAFELALGLRLSAVVRHLYNLPDFDPVAADGVALSVLPFLLNPDDYVRERVAAHHVYLMTDGLKQGMLELPFDSTRLRDAGTPDIFTQAASGTLPIYFKQRFLSCCFIGSKPVLDRLWLEPSPDILPNWVALLAEHLRWGEEVIVVAHPSLEPAGRAIEIGRANQREWLRQQHEVMTQHGHELEGLVKRPGSLPLWQYRSTSDTGVDVSL